MEDPERNSREDSLRLLKETHDFPCGFLIKVIGGAREDFVRQVVRAIDPDRASDDEPTCSVRETPSGRHVAVTVEPHVESAEDVLRIYERIRKIQGVVMIL